MADPAVAFDASVFETENRGPTRKWITLEKLVFGTRFEQVHDPNGLSWLWMPGFRIHNMRRFDGLYDLQGVTEGMRRYGLLSVTAVRHVPDVSDDVRVALMCAAAYRKGQDYYYLDVIKDFCARTLFLDESEFLISQMTVYTDDAQASDDSHLLPQRFKLTSTLPVRFGRYKTSEYHVQLMVAFRPDGAFFDLTLWSVAGMAQSGTLHFAQGEVARVMRPAAPTCAASPLRALPLPEDVLWQLGDALRKRMRDFEDLFPKLMAKRQRALEENAGDGDARMDAVKAASKQLNLGDA